jgi:hypothetical protein
MVVIGASSPGTGFTHPTSVEELYDHDTNITSILGFEEANTKSDE